MTNVFTLLAIIIVGGALLSWLAAQARQPIILGYVVCGFLAGPNVLNLVHDDSFSQAASQFGIALLLFLAGMVLHPNRLVRMFQKTTLLTLVTCIVQLAVMFPLLLLMGYPPGTSFIIGYALMFSSTILVVKLLPTTALHHLHMGSICIAVLIAQDLLAIGLLVVMSQHGDSSLSAWFLTLPLKAIGIIAFAFAFEQFVLRPMLIRAQRFHETLFMMYLGWCVGMALLAHAVGFSHEVGAFLGGLALARNPMSRFVSEELKPIRDFFLMFFFFILGARLDIHIGAGIFAEAFVIAGVLLVLKPAVFRFMLRRMGENPHFASQTALRLGQSSEFGLIISMIALESGRIPPAAGQLVTVTVILTMLVSSYLVVLRYPTPLGAEDKLKQD